MKRGEVVCDMIGRVMPCFFENLNGIVHRYESERYNLYGNQIKVLNGVKIKQPISPATLSRILHMQKGSLTTIIQSLVEMKLLSKSYSKTDTRRYNLLVTSDGLKLLKKKAKEDAECFEMLFAGMEDSEFAKAVEGINSIIKYFNKEV